jgi:hypothetical protein
MDGWPYSVTGSKDILRGAVTPDRVFGISMGRGPGFGTRTKAAARCDPGYPCPAGGNARSAEIEVWGGTRGRCRFETQTRSGVTVAHRERREYTLYHAKSVYPPVAKDC